MFGNLGKKLAKKHGYVGRKHPMDFDNWLKAVNDAVEAYCDLSRENLPDCCYRDWYDEGMSPQAAAKKAIKAAHEG